MSNFEKEYPFEIRPRKAIEKLEEWIETDMFKMAVIRAASLDSHAAAREIGIDNSARSVARAAGQAVATAHVKTHSLVAAMYCLQSIHRAADPEDLDKMLLKERKWQYQHLIELSKS